MKSATRTMVSTFGAWTGLMGIEHGLGEILQGNVTAGAIVFPSWPNSEFFAILSGEPALSIVPNMLITGILATLASLVYIVWVTLLVQRKHSGLVLSLVSVLMLLFGGGLFPPVFGIFIAAAAARINRPPNWGQMRLSAGVRQTMKVLWPWFFGASFLAWLAMVPGIPILYTIFGVDNPGLIFSLLACMFGFLLLAIYTGFVRDTYGQSTLSPAG